jgi:hypothetical protein
LIARYTQDRWQAELGWANTFETKDNPGTWNDWWFEFTLEVELINFVSMHLPGLALK